jgi:signal transduction histidine kinase
LLLFFRKEGLASLLTFGLRRSFALRVAALAAALVVIVCGLGFFWGYLRVAGALQEQLDAAIASDAQDLLTEYEAAGPVGLVASVTDATRRHGMQVQLQTSNGETVVGNIRGAPVGLVGFDTLHLPDGRDVRALGAALPGGLNLIVAADLAPLRRSATALTSALPVAGAVAAAAALVLGFFAARQLEKRLRAVSDAAEAVARGDLSRRLPESGTGDEFDRLSATTNTVLARVEALVEGLQATTTSIAHDLRSPLFRLRQALEAALARPRAPAEDAATLEASLAELDVVLATFSALLRIARAEAGVAGAGFVSVDLSDIAGRIAETYEAVAEEAGQSLRAEITPGLHVAGDPDLLRQALANLIENALTHGGPGVAVKLALRPGPAIEVADNGPGIPPEEYGRVLQRFTRLDASRNTPGTGLGLALVAAVARLHGAKLTLGDAGPGLLVTIAFPT